MNSVYALVAGAKSVQKVIMMGWTQFRLAPEVDQDYDIFTSLRTSIAWRQAHGPLAAAYSEGI